ncbi:MAG: ABC transporter substrate-binding protein [Dehalococcoidia bacterium]|nr:MAG: ABC transporter substrate-binding protein [Dehalococcoidia bacterium]
MKTMSMAMALLSVVCLAVLVALAVACEDEEEEAPAPTGTPAPTPTGTAMPAAEVPGITDTEIILGADCPLSGALGAFYATIPQATGAYFNYINETQGGVCGRDIVYKVEDNNDDPAKGVEAVRKLVEKDKVFAIVGSLGDSPHPAVWEYLNEKGVPDILCSAGSHMFGADPEGHPWTVQMIPSFRIEGKFFGQYISENLPGKKVAVLYSNIISGIDELEGVKDGLNPDKNEIVSEQSFELTDVSISSQVTNMKKSGAEVVVVNASPGFSAQAIEQADRLGWEVDWFISYVSSDETMFLFVSPELMEGAISFQALKPAAWTDDPAVAEHYRLMDEYGGPQPTNFTVYAQTLAEVAVEALSRSCDNLTREGLMDALESIKDFHSDLFLDEVNVSFSSTDHGALQTGRMLRAVVEDGKGRWEYFGPLYEFEEEDQE